MRSPAVVIGLLVVAIAASCTGGSGSVVSPTSSASPVGAGNATISGTLTAVGGMQTSPEVLTGCVEVTLASSLGPLRCSVPVGSDGTWSLAVKPGSYAVFGLSPMFNDNRAPCTPDEHNPVRVREGEHVVVHIVCNMK